MRYAMKYLWSLLLSFAFVITQALAQDMQSSIDAYDSQLCALAQKMIVNVDKEAVLPFGLHVQYGDGNGFHTIQMNVDAATNTVSIATTKGETAVDGAALTTHVACKMVNRDRVNDVLNLSRDGPLRSCGDVNRRTYDTVLELLTPAQRAKFIDEGTPLIFTDDYIAASGGEWLPLAIDDYISYGDQGVTVQAPSVRVAWNKDTREFFQGTQHCKLLSASAMYRWMTKGAFEKEATLFPRTKAPCYTPSAMTSTVGSCHFYFAPADAMFCKDYSGPGWTEESARAECGQRHASRAALQAEGNTYEGQGGIYLPQACDARRDTEPMASTCVFQCNADDEALWHTLGAQSNPAAGAMMTRACDLYIAR